MIERSSSLSAFTVDTSGTAAARGHCDGYNAAYYKYECEVHLSTARIAWQ